MTRALGADVSHFHPVQDWSALYDGGVRFLGVKATEGARYLDPTFRAHRDGARMLPFSLVAYYHFARSGDPIMQAERFMDAVGQLRDNERLVLDLEVAPDLPKDLSLSWADKFYTRLMGSVCSDRRPLIYTSSRFWQDIGNPDWDLASEIDLWAPRYNAQGIEPVIPKPWTGAGWKFWQFSESETLAGITGPCDANYFNGDNDALLAYAKLLPTSPAATT